MKLVTGFTLIEVLVAIVILAISLTALLASTQTDISNTNYLIEKNVAHWLADEVINEIQLGLLPTNPSHDPHQQLTRQSLHREWQVDIQFVPTAYTHLYNMTITVIQNKKHLAKVTDLYVTYRQ